MVSLLRKLIADQKDRWFFAGMVVVAANAGGAWSPIGDVTTTCCGLGSNYRGCRGNTVNRSVVVYHTCTAWYSITK